MNDLTREDTLEILKTTQDPTEVGIEAILRTLTEEDFDLLLLADNGSML